MEKRMNKEELIELIESLKLDNNEYWILSSGALVIRGIYPDAGDLDIAVTEKGLQELKNNYNLEEKGNGWYRVNDKIECVLDTKEPSKIEKCGKYNLISIENYYEFLKKSNREKDKARIPLIEDYIKKSIKTKYIIREIEARDNKKVEEIIRSCLIEFSANHEGTAWTDPNLGKFSEIYNTEGNKYWVAEDDKGKIVGGVGIGKLKGADGVCELQKMYCLPEARGTGIAHELIEVALNYAKKYYSTCYLETLKNMIAAQKFYEKYGFTQIDEPIVKTEHFACDVRYIKEL